MDFPSGDLIYARRSKLHTIEVSQNQELRLLRTDQRAIQSALSLMHPQQLELPYMKAMMAGLLFQAPPRSVLLLGLGGGDLVRYLHHYLPETLVNAVEIDSVMVEIAREYFALPESDRIEIVVDDAMHFLIHGTRRYEMMLVDIYSGKEVPELLRNSTFYELCYNSLEQNGMLALNLLTSDAETFKHILWLIRQRFDRSTLCLTIPDHVNIIVFAFKQRPAELTLPALSTAGHRIS